MKSVVVLMPTQGTLQHNNNISSILELPNGQKAVTCVCKKGNRISGGD